MLLWWKHFCEKFTHKILDLERDLFDEVNPNMGLFVAVIDKKVIGYCHFYYTYTLRHGRNMCLQDIYVQAKFRNHGIGDNLMQAVAKVR